MGDLTDKQAAQTVKLVGVDDLGNETEWGAVETIGGKRRLLVDSSGSISAVLETKGFDNFADVWFYVGDEWNTTGVGAAGDTIRVRIVAGPDATLFPAVDVTYTVTAADMAALNREISVASNIVIALNADAVFKVLWKASRVKNNSVVHIVSRINSLWSERPYAGNFTVTVTGTTTVTVPYDTVVRRNKPIEINRDPVDPRYGASTISGAVTTTPGGLGDLYIENAKTVPGGLISMLVDGSITPVNFWLVADPLKDTYLDEVRFYAGAASIKFLQFLAKNTLLVNGIEVTVKSDDATKVFPLIKSTEDFKNKFALGGLNYNYITTPSQEQILASFIPLSPFPLRKSGTFAVDDYVKISIRDNILTAASNFEALGYGFYREA